MLVEATERSGSLITADIALQLGRTVAAVPGPVTSPQSRGTNALLRDGAEVVRDARDVLDLALGVGHPLASEGCEGCDEGEALPDELAHALALVDAGHATPSSLALALGDAARALVTLTRLELLGVLRREGDGRYVRRLL